jgi:hypothetical protein
MVRDNTFVALPPALSVNFTVKLAAPAAEGVPPITPVDAARLKPCGKVPTDIVHVTGETAPDAASVAEYGEPAVPFANAAVVITGLELLIVMLKACVAEAPAASCTLTVNGIVSLVCGIPLMVPPLLSASPAGSSAPADTDQE